MNRRLLFALLTAIVLLRVAPARAQDTTAPRPTRPSPHTLGLLGGLGYLESPSLGGSAFMLGVRYRPITHFALSFDAGYGLLNGDAQVQDRWWLMPSVALVVPVRRLQLELGAGLGFGATSGYRSWDAYFAGPFDPTWALQLVPTFRAHAMAIAPVTRTLDVFVRADTAVLLLGGNSIGSRVNDPDPPAADTLWLDLTVGVHFRVL